MHDWNGVRAYHSIENAGILPRGDCLVDLGAALGAALARNHPYRLAFVEAAWATTAGHLVMSVPS
jgi:hypothetical protein